LFRGLFRMYDENPALAAEFVRSLPGADGTNAHAVNGLTFAFLHRLSVLIRAAQQRGEIDAAVTPMLAAQTIFTLYFGALMAWLNRFVDHAVDLEPLLREALTLHFRGLYPR
ncbi:MAG TPA: TetR/AcrR family transcriptional regulator, partial [Polyangiaceae bacterium]|nr:TetR/AcrR family transcriptional regulator [Polyangiaceae bacterium]